MLNRKIAIAPMMDWTDSHCRYFLRLISKHVLLYTEMVTTGAILHGKRDYLLAYNPSEHPIALQLGGSDPQALAQCAKIAEGHGYDEVNLNVGCPSNRVQTGRFGACLMAEPELVAECVAAMRAVVKIPVTIKTRIGIDDLDSYEHLSHFIKTIAANGCDTFIIHARKAWLKGLSPKQNREIPPLNYDVVYKIKHDFPNLQIIINGGITDLNQVKQHLEVVDGAMLGRAAYHNPYLLAEIDHQFYGADTSITHPHMVLERFIPYAEQQLSKGVPLSHMTRHILGLFQGIPGARAWRRHLSEHAPQKNAEIGVIKKALSFL